MTGRASFEAWNLQAAAVHLRHQSPSVETVLSGWRGVLVPKIQQKRIAEPTRSRQMAVVLKTPASGFR